MSSKRHPVKLFFWILGILLLVGVSTIAGQVVVGKVMVWMLGAETFSKPLPMTIYSILSYLLAMALIVIISTYTSIRFKRKGDKKTLVAPKRNWRTEKKTIGLSDWPTWTDIGLAPVGFIVYMILAAIMVGIFSQFSWFNPDEVQQVGFNHFVLGFDRILAFLTLVVVAPVSEEIIFRGWLYGKMREKIALEYSNTFSIIASSLLVSLLFGIIHMQWNVSVNVFAMSLVLCAMREITGTIYSGILLHMIKNGVAFWILYVMGL
ncbi:CPBP family intramembrane metalloprotease [Candidatus Saccharibacteria bacterium]|nr:CPBP family intramembrane metalloprotease [Candidatus Saccharibacteria bacterium]